MTSPGPLQPEVGQDRGPGRGSRGLRNLPGFTTAAVVFFLIVLLGAGGAAMAKWNQSATVSIAVTAGSAATTSPSPTPSASPSPSATVTAPPSGQGNIVARPLVLSRPQLIDPSSVKCDANGNSGNYTLVWTGDNSGATGYIVTVGTSDKNYGSVQSKTVYTNTSTFSLDNKDAAYGQYVLRIQPMKGGVPGDAVYRLVRHGKWSQQCDYLNPNGQSPLGTFSIGAVTAPDIKRPNSNVVTISWAAAAKATPTTRYVVTVLSTSTTSSYGAEFSTAELGAVLTFPPRVWDQGGNSVADGDYFGEYKLRIQPVDGALVGDPVYVTLQYNKNNFGYW